MKDMVDKKGLLVRVNELYIKVLRRKSDISSPLNKPFTRRRSFSCFSRDFFQLYIFHFVERSAPCCVIAEGEIIYSVHVCWRCRAMCEDHSKWAEGRLSMRPVGSIYSS